MLAFIGFNVSYDVYLLCKMNFSWDSCGRCRCDDCDMGGEDTVQRFLAEWNEEEWGPKL